MLDHPLRRGHGAVGLQLRVAGPVGGGRQALEQPGRAEHQGSGAHRGGETGAGMGVAHPLEHARVALQRSGAHAAGEHDHVGFGQFFEGRIGGQPEHAVLAADLAALVPDEGDVDGRDPLEHLIRPDAIERGEAGEQRDGDLQLRGHADVLSSVTLWKRRR